MCACLSIFAGDDLISGACLRVIVFEESGPPSSNLSVSQRSCSAVESAALCSR